MSQNTCEADDCDRQSAARGWCSMHYNRWLRTGSIEARKPHPCKVESCLLNAEARGWCRSHYERWRSHGDPLGGRAAPGLGLTCAIAECESPVKSRGWCSRHYRRWLSHGDPLAGRPMYAPGTLCQLDDCNEPVRSNGYCRRHHQKWFKTGDPLTPDRHTRRGAPLIERIEASVVKTSGCWFWLKTINRSGYGTIGVGGRTLLAHRVSYEVHVGSIPDGLVVDHLCRNRACVNPDHLEPVTTKVNVQRGDTATRKSHCRNDHEFTKATTRWVRICTKCEAASKARWKARQES